MTDIDIHEHAFALGTSTTNLYEVSLPLKCLVDMMSYKDINITMKWEIDFGTSRNNNVTCMASHYTHK